MRSHSFRGLMLAATLAVASTGLAFAQTAGQDMHSAGHETKDAAVDTGHATKHVAKKTYHGTKHVAKKTGSATEHGAKVAGHDTKVGAEKTGHGIHKLGDKIAGKPTPQ